MLTVVELCKVLTLLWHFIAIKTVCQCSLYSILCPVRRVGVASLVISSLVRGHAKLCMRGWQRLYSYFVAASPAIMVTAVTSVAKSHYGQTARVAEGLPDRRWE